MAGKPRKKRLDELLVERGAAESIEESRRILMAGRVRVEGLSAPKPGDRVPESARLEVAGLDRYVGRGGHKLEAALAHFRIDPSGRVCMDVGASTGGFTDCLLQHGAARVFALDVGTNQLAWKIRSDPRVVSREGFNVRNLQPGDIDGEVSLLVADVSFISLTLILPPACAVLTAGGLAVLLIKPQFEVEKEKVDAGGVVTDVSARREAVAKIQRFVCGDLRMEWMGCIPSPLRGARSGNEEFLAAFRKP